MQAWSGTRKHYALHDHLVRRNFEVGEDVSVVWRRVRTLGQYGVLNHDVGPSHYQLKRFAGRIALRFAS